MKGPAREITLHSALRGGQFHFRVIFQKYICFDAQNTLLNDLIRAPVNMRLIVFSELCVIAIQSVKFFQMHTKPGFCQN